MHKNTLKPQPFPQPFTEMKMTELYFKENSQTYSKLAGEYANNFIGQQCKRQRRGFFKIKIKVYYFRDSSQKFCTDWLHIM